MIGEPGRDLGAIGPKEGSEDAHNPFDAGRDAVDSPGTEPPRRQPASDERDLYVAQQRFNNPHVYLQFDGFEVDTHLRIRGRDLRDEKERALDACAEAGLHVTLVAAVEKGINEHEAGAIVRYGVEHPAVMSVAFQPVTHSGRHLVFDPLDRLTNADVIKLLSTSGS